MENTLVKALELRSIDEKCSIDEKRVRRYVMNSIIDKGEVFNIEKGGLDLCKELSLDKATYRSIIERLMDKNVVAVEDGHVNFIYPVSGFPTNHQVTLGDGRNFNAMCGIDAMGSSYTFETDVNIASVCADCGQPIRVHIKDGVLNHFEPSSAYVLHVDLEAHDNWSGNC